MQEHQVRQERLLFPVFLCRVGQEEQVLQALLVAEAVVVAAEMTAVVKGAAR